MVVLNIKSCTYFHKTVSILIGSALQIHVYIHTIYCMQLCATVKGMRAVVLC